MICRMHVKEHNLANFFSPEHDERMKVRALASKNDTLFYFIIKKNYFINYIIPFYNTSSIPNFYFPILLDDAQDRQ